MTFRAYKSSPFDHTHENVIFDRLYDILSIEWSERSESLSLFGNFYINGCEIDSLIIKRDAIIVVDFKDYGGTLRFSENSSWTIDGVNVAGGSKINPYQQIRNYKFRLLNFIKDTVNLQSSPNLGHIAGLCIFHQKISFDPGKIPQKVSRWFHIADINTAKRTVDALGSPEISLTKADIDEIVLALDIPHYTPDGRPKELYFSPKNSEPTNDLYKLNGQQALAVESIKTWLESETKVLSVKGPNNSGKQLVAKVASDWLVNQGKNVINIAPNAAVATLLKQNGISNVYNIYGWIYESFPEIKSYQALYSMQRLAIDPDNDVIIVFDAHLLNNGKFETDTLMFGTGFIIDDFFNSIVTANQQYDTTDEATVDSSLIPKILLFGDPYQISMGSPNSTLLNCEIFKRNKVSNTDIEIRSQHIDSSSKAEFAEFQQKLIRQISSQKFTELPESDQSSIKTVAAGENDAQVAESILKWPRDAVYLSATNENVARINGKVRRKYLHAQNSKILTVGDVVELQNRTIDIRRENETFETTDMLQPDCFAYVQESAGIIETKSIRLKNWEQEIHVTFARATISFLDRTAEIVYLPDFLAGDKPKLEFQQEIALQVWTRQEIERKLSSDKANLRTAKNTPTYAKLRREYLIKEHKIRLRSRYHNAARLRFAYALTVFRAQSRKYKLPTIILDGRSSHDTDQPATDSYFRQLYTASTRASKVLMLIEYPRLSPLSKTQWTFNEVQITPVRYKQRFHYSKPERAPPSELPKNYPKWWDDTNDSLNAVFLTVVGLLEQSQWQIEGVSRHQYKERYTLTQSNNVITVDFDYNKHFDFTIGNIKILNGSEELRTQIQKVLRTEPIFENEHIKYAYNVFEKHNQDRNWKTISIDEAEHSAILTVRNDVGCAKVMIIVPSSSIGKKGVISHVKLRDAENNEVVEQWKTDFVDV